MPPEHLWALVVALAVLAFSTSIHAATSAHRLKMAYDELAAFLTKFNALKQEYDEKISNISQLHKTEIEKLNKELSSEMRRIANESFEDFQHRKALVHALRNYKS